MKQKSRTFRVISEEWGDIPTSIWITSAYKGQTPRFYSMPSGSSGKHFPPSRITETMEDPQERAQPTSDKSRLHFHKGEN